MRERMNSKEPEKRQKENLQIGRMFTLIMQFSINMLVPMALCFFLGYWLDKKIGTDYLVIIFFFVGAFAGFRNIYIFVKKVDKLERSSKTESEKQDEEILRKMQYMDERTDKESDNE